MEKEKETWSTERKGGKVKESEEHRKRDKERGKNESRELWGIWKLEMKRYVYIYIYIERERDRQTDRETIKWGQEVNSEDDRKENGNEIYIEHRIYIGTKFRINFGEGCSWRGRIGLNCNWFAEKENDPIRTL